MTDKEKIEMLERENAELKRRIEFLSDYSKVLVEYVLEDIKIRNEQADQQLKKFKETMRVNNDT